MIEPSGYDDVYYDDSQERERIHAQVLDAYQKASGDIRQFAMTHPGFAWCRSGNSGDNGLLYSVAKYIMDKDYPEYEWDVIDTLMYPVFHIGRRR